MKPEDVLAINENNRQLNSFSNDIHQMHTKYKFYDAPFTSKSLAGRLSFLEEELVETVEAFNMKNSEEVVDGLIDLIVVAIGTLDFLKVNTNEAWSQVHKANMRKEPRQNTKRPGMTVDLIKPVGWSPPTHDNNLGVLPEIFKNDAIQFKWSYLEKVRQKSKRFAVKVMNDWGKFLLKKSQDYNTSVPTIDYFPNGMDDFQYMLNIKLLRVKSVLSGMKSGNNPNFESIEDSLRDLGIYAAMGVEYLNGKMDGQNGKLKSIFGNRDYINESDNSAKRIGINEYWMIAAMILANRSTCPRRKVGAILTSDANKILASGYNGVPKDISHCNENSPCPGAQDESGNTKNCIAVHAEINAIISCTDLSKAINLYTTTFPCFNCVKSIANTGIKRIYFIEDYPDERGKNLLKSKGINVLKLDKQQLIDQGLTIFLA